MAFTRWYPIKSSNLKEARYDHASGKVQVRFQSGPTTYEYGDDKKKLSEAAWQEWFATFQADTSSFPLFQKLVKGALPCTPLKEEKGG